MFEAAEIGDSLSKKAYKKAVARLRISLLAAQRGLAASNRSLIVVVAGVEGAGKSEFVNLLMTWLDARGVETHALGKPTDEERERPYFWRFWRLLPARRRTGIFLTSWYTDVIVARALKKIGSGDFDQDLDRIIEFERMLVDENTVLIKLWFHISAEEQAKRFRALEKDPATRWRVTARDWKFHKKYGKFRKVCEHALIKTGSPQAPWRIVAAGDRRYGNVAAARLILDGLKTGLSRPEPQKPARARPPKPKPNNIIRRLDLSLKLNERTFKKRLEDLQGRLGMLTRRLKKRRRSLTLVFEGPDAAGKGGAIRRITGAIDARLFRVHSVSAPTDEEKAHPYLWRFWRELPRIGRTTIYDRSWYGRVLVERVEGFASPTEWRRAFGEINAFEDQLFGFETIVLKFWIAISPEEELRRFKLRQETPYKQYKLTPEDWRNREKWDAYEAAACEMIECTGTDHAPWTLVEGEDKNWARIKILESIAARLAKELN